MSIHCGTDIVYIPNITKLIDQPETLAKFFQESELPGHKPEHIAGIIAAKEAFFKAVGIIPKFRDIAITYDQNGKPQIALSPTFDHYLSHNVSISHDGDYAIATVVLEK